MQKFKEIDSYKMQKFKEIDSYKMLNLTRFLTLRANLCLLYTSDAADE